MDRIKAATVFIVIVEQGSMIKAADILGMSRSMVTRYLSEMEDWAGTRLLHRSTRRLGLTDAGKKVLTECYKLQEIEKDVKFAADENLVAPKGTLRIAASQFLAERILIPYVQSYLTKYPQVTIDIQVNNHAVNLVEERIDLALRITNNLDPNVIARNFGRLNSVICASKSYLSEKGAPEQIDQLSHHNCLTYSYFGKSTWYFEGNEKEDSVEVAGNLCANDPTVLLKATLMGLGISIQPIYSVAQYIENNDLVALFPEKTAQSLGIYGIYRSRKHVSHALRVFIDDFSLYVKSLKL